MQNKGMVFYSFLDKNYVGQEDDYLTELETQLKDQDRLHIKSLQRKLKASRPNSKEEKKKDSSNNIVHPQPLTNEKPTQKVKGPP